MSSALARHHGRSETLVLGIVRGGVPVASEVARTLDLPLDLVLVRPLIQRGPGPPLGAARVAGTLVLDDALQAMANAPRTPEGIFLVDALDAFTQRDRACRGERPPLSVAGRTVLLVDNGVRTGGTMRSAIGAIRRLHPARIVAAVPVGAEEGLALVTSLADEAIWLASPSPFPHVGVWYQRFDVPSEAEIAAMLDEHSR